MEGSRFTPKFGMPIQWYRRLTQILCKGWTYLPIEPAPFYFKAVLCHYCQGRNGLLRQDIELTWNGAVIENFHPLIPRFLLLLNPPPPYQWDNNWRISCPVITTMYIELTPLASNMTFLPSPTPPQTALISLCWPTEQRFLKCIRKMASEDVLATEPPDLHPIFLCLGWDSNNVAGSRVVHITVDMIWINWTGESKCCLGRNGTYRW